MPTGRVGEGPEDAGWGRAAPFGYHLLLSLISLSPPGGRVEQGWSPGMVEPAVGVSAPADPRPAEPVPTTCQNQFSGASPESFSCPRLT